jgi:thiamine biosynthesis protein ThiS
MSVIKISVNGEIKEIGIKKSILQLVLDLGLDVDKIAIEKNKDIVHLEQYSKVFLKNGDVLEVVHFVGGG